jgi:hypothetical protein
MKLHGQPVSVGDIVYDMLLGKGEVIGPIAAGDAPPLPGVIIVDFGPKYGPIPDRNTMHYDYDGHANHQNALQPPRLTWQPIAKQALAAARTKPAPPEYEWQWIVQRADGTCYLTLHATERKGFPYEQDAKVLGKLEVSKREVVPPIPPAEWKVSEGDKDNPYFVSHLCGTTYGVSSWGDGTRLVDLLNGVAFKPYDGV